jgi:protein SCO1/2
MRKKIIFYCGFFVILFVLFYLALTKIIPGYGEVKLPVLSDVQPFFFRDQDGRLITQKDVEGKVYIAEYFFTTCKGICPKMNSNLKDIYTEFKDEPDFRILSHTVDPETDSVQRMKHYADSLQVDSKTWFFLTGSKDSLYRAARVSYLLDDPKNNAEDIAKQFIHTQFFALIDRNGQVRKIVDGLKKDEMAELETSIASLLREKPGINHFSSPLNGNNTH